MYILCIIQTYDISHVSIICRLLKVPEWTNEWTYELAESTCNEYLSKRFPADLSEMTGENPSDYIAICVDDIKVFRYGSPTIVDYIITH